MTIEEHIAHFSRDIVQKEIISISKAIDVEAGFEYVCTTPDDLLIFRKRK